MSETETTQDRYPLRRRPMAKQYALITPELYVGSMRKAGPYVLADWPWILSHMDRDGVLDFKAWVLADEIGGDLAEHRKALEWLQRPDPENECQEDKGQWLFRVGNYMYYVAHHEQYRFSWQSLAKAEYQKAWDRQYRPSGWQREKAKRNGPNQSDEK